jgi:nucleotide-binding universal stress UspA family protein
MMKVLLAVDGSDASMSAVAATAALPTRPGSEIRVVSVVPTTFAPEGSPWPNVIRVDPPNDRERVFDDVARRLLDIADRLRVGDRTVHVEVLDGRPATEIVLEAERWGADLIVMGARGLSTARRLLIGSVSSEVVDHAPCPVLVARGDGIHRVLWATDESAESEYTADFIAESALFDDAEIRILSVAEPAMAWWAGISPVDGATSMEVYADAAAFAERRAKTTAEAAADRLSGRRVTAVYRHPGDIPYAILQEAETFGAQLIILGARRLGAVHRWLIGSVSRSVLHHAPMSVLIVRPKVAHTEEREAAVAATA